MREGLGSYLANMQTSIFTISYQQIGDNWSYTNMKHEYNLLYYIVSGSCTIRANEEEIHPVAGQLVLLPEGTAITTSSNDKQFSKYYCHFTAAIGETRLFDLIRLSTVIDVPGNAELKALFDELLRYSTDQQLTSALRCKSLLLQLICNCIEYSPFCKFNDTGNTALEAINSVLHYMERHLSEKLSVEKLAARVHFHPHYFIQVFKTMVGCPPMQHLTKLRFQQACLLLSSTRMSVNEIAERVGIDPEYFAKFFRHHSGMTPTAYRNRPGAV